MHYNLFHCILYCVCYLFSQRFGRLSPGIPQVSVVFQIFKTIWLTIDTRGSLIRIMAELLEQKKDK